jgi:hypothetical protein
MHGLTHVPGGPDPIPGLQMQADKFDEIILAQPSLLGYWPLYDGDDPTSGLTADYSTSEHHLTDVSGSVGFTGARGADQTGAEFDSASGFGSGGDLLRDDVSPSSLYYFSGTLPYTFTIVVQPSHLPAATSPIDWGIMIVYQHPSGSTGGMRISLVSTSTNNSCIRVARAGNEYTGPVLWTINPASVPPDELLPVLVTVTYDGATLKLYYDAALAGSWADTASHSASGALQLGQYYNGSYYSNFNGNLMQAAVFNDALGVSVIEALAEAAEVELAKQVDSIRIDSDDAKLTGDIVLKAGSGVTLTRTGNTITISSP